MKLNIGHAIKDGCLLSWVLIGSILKYYFGALMFMTLTIVFALTLYPAMVVNLGNLYLFKYTLIFSPMLFLLGYWMLMSHHFEKSFNEMNKRLKFAFDDLEKQMRASDFWKPLFTKPKRKK